MIVRRLIAPAHPTHRRRPNVSAVRRPRRPRYGQRGAALLMALVVAALATLIVSGLFWRHFVLLRTIENQQMVSESRLLLRGALDWAKAILREDAANSSYDALTEAWAQPLAETRLDQLGETSALASQASMSGYIEDAQSRLNLRNLVDTTGLPNPDQILILTRLCAELSLPEQTPLLIAQYMSQAIPPGAQAAPATTTAPGTAPVSTAPGTSTAPDGSGGASARPLPPVFPEDVGRIPGLDPAAGQRLAPYVVFLDASSTQVNFNTAPAEVIAAVVKGLSLSDARSFVANRDRVPYNKVGDVLNSAQLRNFSIPGNTVSVTSSYFFIHGEIKLQRADTRMEALVKRAATGSVGQVETLWEREL